MDVSRPHAVANFEPGRCRGGAGERAGCQDAAKVGLRQGPALDRATRSVRVAGHQLSLGDKVTRHQKVLEPCEPTLVVGTGEIGVRRQKLDPVSANVDVPLLQPAKRAAHRQHAPLPRRMEYPFVRLALDRPEPVHTPHVVHAVHGAAAGGSTWPVPTMLSRVTSAASRSASQPSVLVGRIGSTR